MRENMKSSKGILSVPWNEFITCAWHAARVGLLTPAALEWPTAHCVLLYQFNLHFLSRRNLMANIINAHNKQRPGHKSKTIQGESLFLSIKTNLQFFRIPNNCEKAAAADFNAIKLNF